MAAAIALLVGEDHSVRIVRPDTLGPRVLSASVVAMEDALGEWEAVEPALATVRSEALSVRIPRLSWRCHSRPPLLVLPFG